MGVRDVDASMRMLVRHQWVRDHGTPRVTTLAGTPDVARALWFQWLTLTGRSRDRRRFFAQPARANERWLEAAAAKATHGALECPHDAIAIAVERELLTRWLRGHEHRHAAFIAEGIVPVPGGRAGGRPEARIGRERARSVAEMTLFEALEATPVTAGRFRLNQCVSFHFGSRAAEIDLLSRTDNLAIEIDGHHHFAHPDAYRRDRRKDLLLQGHGYTVLRFLAADVLADTRGVVQEILEYLGHRKRHDEHGS